MSTASKIDISKIHLIGILPIKFDIYNDKLNPLTNDEIEGFNYSFDSNTGYNKEDKLIKITLEAKVKIETKEEWEGKAGAEFVYDFIFNIDNFDDYFDEESQSEVALEGLFVSTLIGLSFSTMRGLVIARSGGTVIENAIFPVVNPRAL